MPDIKESKEAVVAVAALMKAAKDLAKDGVQFSDAIALWDKYDTDPVFAGKLDAGLTGLQYIAAELSDISLFEGLELMRVIRAEFSK